jgi:hypothetical protein
MIGTGSADLGDTPVGRRRVADICRMGADLRRHAGPSSACRRRVPAVDGAAPPARARRLGQDNPSGEDEAALIGEHDRLDAVVVSQLREDSVDVRLGRRRADHEPLGDLCLGQPVGDEQETSCSRSVRRPTPWSCQRHLGFT